MKLPIFPLPIFLLPGGITRIRVFEPKYLALVRVASQDKGFVIAIRSKDEDVDGVTWGSWVDIVNFSQSDDNILIIDVQCKGLVDVESTSLADDGLFYAITAQRPHWQETLHDDDTKVMTSVLYNVLDTMPVLSELYENKLSDDPTWAISRWIEILPINLEVKKVFADKASFNTAKDFVSSVISENNLN